MRAVVIGGTGLIGAGVVRRLGELGYEALPGTPRTGVDVMSGKGLAEALDGAALVIDVSNPSSLDERAVMDFFTTGTRNLVEAASNAGVLHYVALSVVGAERMGGSPYMRAKTLQDGLVASSSLPHTIVRATQFFEFVERIADSATLADSSVHLSPVRFQPMAAAEVASAVARTATSIPTNGVVELGGPEVLRLDETVRRALGVRADSRQVVGDPDALYFGARLDDDTLLPGDAAHLGEVTFEAWLRETAAASPTHGPSAPRSPKSRMS